MPYKGYQSLFLTIIIAIVLAGGIKAQEQFTFEDVMKFEDIKTPVISANGEWVAFGVWPEIGDGEVRIKSVNSASQFILERGERPQLNNDGSWAGAIIQPDRKSVV